MELLAAAAGVAVPAIVLPAHRYRRLSTLQRWSCVALHNDGRSNTYIATKLKVGRDTVAATLRRYRDTGDVKSGSRDGRPRATDPEAEHAIELTARIDKFTSPRRIARQLFLDVSPRTVDRRLQEVGLFGRVARHKRDYKPVEIRKRLSFANGYGHHDADWWEKVLFSDEKCFYSGGFCGREWVRREVGTALHPEYCVPQRHKANKINVWACFCAAGQGYIYCFNENMNGVLLRKILRENLVPSAELHFAVGREQWHLLHDNDKKFGCDIVQEFLHNKGVSCIDFPPYSPDLNPIENLWAVMARAVDKHAAETLDELQDAIAKEWDLIDPEFMRKLARSMPDRCAAVIAAEGSHTKY